MIKCFFYLLTVLLWFSSCSNEGEIQTNGGVTDYKQEMRNFVQGISSYSKNIHPGFIIIPQNGQEIVTNNGLANGMLSLNYINSVDATAREDLFYGYENDNERTLLTQTNYFIPFLNIFKNNNKKVLVVDYCSTPVKMDSSYIENEVRGYISLAAPDRLLGVIPSYPSAPHNVNSNNITTISEAKNFLYLLDFSNFSSRQDFINAVNQTNYDLIITDCFFQDNSQFTSAEINSLKTKAGGGSRLVVSYLSIGEAENYRYYWQNSWNSNPPVWLAGENPNWQGNFKVRYWYADWQNIIFGNNSSYTKKILDSGFDGVYLDIIDAFEYFENGGK